MDKYKIIKEIGKGNYGRALLTRSTIDKNVYVVKSIDITNFNKEQLNSALYEVSVLKALNHPFIIRYIESFYEENNLCIVMEYADCGDLYKFLKSQKSIGNLIKEDIIINWFVQLCFAIKYIHEKKILHRDLKLSNIFLASNGDIKLGDFGISKMLSNTEDYAKTLVGTPYYLSPEICLKKSYNKKSDIWSLGCILYEMMNLQHAFEADNIAELILKILKGAYEPMVDLNQNKSGKLVSFYPQYMKDLVKTMLNTNSTQRPDANVILENEHLLRYIKLNVVKQMSAKRPSVLYFEEEDDEERNKIKSNTRTRTWSNSSSNKSKSQLKCSSIAPVYSSGKGSGSVNSLEVDVVNMSGAKVRRSNEDTNSVFSKIEKLKKLLERLLGLEKFIEIYSKINENPSKVNVTDLNMTDGRGIVKLISSLIQLENNMYAMNKIN